MPRLITWNCNCAFIRKCTELLKLDADVIVLQEVEESFVPPAGYRYFWTGLLPNRGLGVLARDPDANQEPVREEWTFFLPVVLPNLGLRVLATWAFHHRAKKIHPDRIGTISPVLEELAPWLRASGSVVAGDFNHNPIWDTPRGKNNFRPLVDQLRQLGLRSAYHEMKGEDFGAERLPTHLFQRNAQREYHIDYCFLHESLAVEGAEILSGPPWVGLSDHLPLVVDLRAA